MKIESIGLADIFSPKPKSGMALIQPFIFIPFGEDARKSVPVLVPIWLQLLQKPIQAEQLEALAVGPETLYSKFQTLESWCKLPQVTLVENGIKIVVPLAVFLPWATLVKQCPKVAAFTPVIFTHEYTNHVLAGLGWE